MNTLMAKKGLNLREVSRNVGILQQTLNKQVNKDTLPDIEQAYKICRFFGISMENFTRGTEPDLPNLSRAYIKIAYAIENLSEEGKEIALNTVKGLEISYPLGSSKSSDLLEA